MSKVDIKQHHDAIYCDAMQRKIYEVDGRYYTGDNQPVPEDVQECERRNIYLPDHVKALFNRRAESQREALRRLKIIPSETPVREGPKKSKSMAAVMAELEKKGRKKKSARKSKGIIQKG